LFVVLFCISTVVLGANSIVSGVPWYDTSGNRLVAGGGGFLLDKGTYYWYGESAKTDGTSEHGVNCYSSTDLYNWKFEGVLLQQKDIVLPQKGPYIVERPKVVYNAKTKLYVMWFHLDNGGYSLRYAGVATSSTPNGHFTFVKGFQPDGIPSLDQSVFEDDDGAAYQIRSCDNKYVGISKLSDDYLSTTGLISQIGEPREGPSMFKYNGLYYLVTSHLTGWSPNAMEMFVGGKILNGTKWTSLGNPSNDPTTYNSQSTNVLIFDKTIVYQGDRWNHDGPGGLMNATYVWLPIVPSSSGNSFTIPWHASWKFP